MLKVVTEFEEKWTQLLYVCIYPFVTDFVNKY